MAILFAGGEFDAFIMLGSSFVFDAGSPNGDPNFCRGGMSYAAGSEPVTPDFGADQLEVWAHMVTRQNGSSPQGSGFDLLELRNSSDQGVVRLRMIAAGTIQLQYYNGTAWTAVNPTFNISGNTVYSMDLYVKIDDVAGMIEWYRNGVLQASFYGDTNLFSGASIRKAKIGMLSNVNGGANRSDQSEIIIATQDTRSMRLATLVPNGNGALDQWTGSFNDVDEVGVYTDFDYISSGTAEQVELFTVSDLSATAQTLDVVGVVVTGRGRKGAGGPQNLQMAIYTGGVQYNTGDLPGLTNAFATLQPAIWDQNPQTLAPWTVAEVQQLQIGFQSKA